MESKYFYDEISGFYGKMIDFEKNLKLRIDSYKNIFPVPGRVADIGCGIGLDSIALAQNRHTVYAFDPSTKMIEQTKRNSAKYNLDITAQVESFETLSNKYKEYFDYVVSVGNTIAHLSVKQLYTAIKTVHNILKPGGKVFLHILNYDLILHESKRINNIAVRDGLAIIRFYDLARTKIKFNILSFSVEKPRDFKLVTTFHYPHSHLQIKHFLINAGFTKIKLNSNFHGDKFEPKNSKDIFIEAYKK